MAYDEFLADRIRQNLAEERITFEEKKMMGGLCFMIDHKMCVGIIKENFMARIGPERYELALEMDHCKAMDFTGRPLKGYVYVEPEGIENEDQLKHWIKWCLDFNPLAKASRKKKK